LRRQEAEDRRRLAEAEAKKRRLDDERRRLEKVAKLAAKEEQRRKRLEQEPQQPVKRWLLPLIGAGATSLSTLLVGAFIGGYLGSPEHYHLESLLFFVVFITQALYGGAAGMLVQRFGIPKAVTIPIIPAILLTVVFVALIYFMTFPKNIYPLYKPSFVDADDVRSIVYFFVPAVMCAWLAFWWPRRHQTLGE